MSGIFGYIKKNSDATEEHTIALDIWHREYGKQKGMHIKFPEAVLGCRVNQIREDIIEEDEVLNEKNRYYGVFDALIYNREELVERVKGYSLDVSLEKLDGISDERLLFYIFLNEGENGLREVNGDFCGAIYDSKEKKLNVFRDHLGVRPLFLYEDNSMIAFATDYRGFLAMPDANVDVCEEYLYEKLKGNCISEKEMTYFKCITAVPPAYVICISKEKRILHKTEYWKLGEKKIACSSEKEYMNEMRRLVQDSIERRLAVCKGPVGGEMSGGLDSTVIDVIIQKTGKESYFCSWSPSIEKFSIQNMDERINIQETCKMFNMDCHYIDFKEGKEEMIDYLESILPVDVYGRVIKEGLKHFENKGAKIAFSGWGGDEGISHRANPLELWMHKEYKDYLYLQWIRTKGERWRFLRFCKRVLNNLTVEKWKIFYPNNKFINREKNDYIPLNPEFERSAKGKIKGTPVYFSFNPIKEIENGANRKRVEAAAVCGAQYGVQYVFPFLDYRVEDFGVSIPRKLYLKGYQNRYIYRETFKEELGKLYYYQYKNDPGRKYFFNDEKMNNRKQITCEYVLEHLDKKYWSRYLDFEKLQDALKDMKEGKMDSLKSRKMEEALQKCYQIQQLQTKTREYIKIFRENV